MKRLALIAGVIIASIIAPGGCGKAEDKPAPAATATPTRLDTIALPLGTGDPVGTATTYLEFVDNALREIDRGSIFGDRSKGFHGLDRAGILTSSVGGFTTPAPHAAFPITSPTAVFVDRETPATAFRTASGSALRGRCWGFAVADHGKLELQEPDPCPPAARPNDQVNLDLYVTTAGKAAALLSTGQRTSTTTALATPGELSAYLVAQKAGAFNGRRDLTIAFDEQARISTVVDALVRAHAAGFTAAAWVEGSASDELRALTR